MSLTNTLTALFPPSSFKNVKILLTVSADCSSSLNPSDVPAERERLKRTSFYGAPPFLICSFARMFDIVDFCIQAPVKSRYREYIQT